MPLPSHDPRRAGPGVPVFVAGGLAVGVLGWSARALRHAREAHARLLDAEQRTRQLLDSTPDAMVIVDADGVIVSANAQAERLFGHPRERLVGAPVELLIDEAHQHAHRRHRSAFVHRPELRPMGAGLTLHARRSDGSRFPVEISLSPLRTDEGLLVIAAVRDVTDRARDEAEQQALRRVATAVAEEAGAPAVFGLVAHELARLLNVPVGMVVRFEGDGRGAVLGLWEADHGLAGEGEWLALGGDDAVSLVARTGRSALARDAAPVPGSGAISRLRPTTTVAAPITVGGVLWGAVGVAADGTPLPQGSEARVARFADLVALAISNAEAWETLARHAATDAMTGLPNYRAFQEHLRAESERARRHGRELGVVLFDLDEFKAINDTYGHHTGDKVLAEVGQRLAAQARAGEVVARVGGEEFAWLLPETDGAGAFAAAERARAAIEREPFGIVGHMTASAGVCSLADPGGPDSLMRMADRALYAAKDAGRNATFRYTEAAQHVLADTPDRARRFQSMSSIRALARAIDAKDFGTRSHSERVAAIAEQLALSCGWTTKRARQLYGAALLHDVGKIGIADAILLKPGPLAEDEWEEMRRHPAIGAQIVGDVLEEEGARWVRHHHERWDGEGYPDRLAGEQIPDGAQLLALADAWDVMTSVRLYKGTLSFDEAIAECRRERGHQFAPAAVDALLALSRGVLEGVPGDGDDDRLAESSPALP